MLTSIAIEHLNDTFGSRQDIGVAYIYCDYKIGNEQRPLNLLASLLKQLLIQKSSIPEHIQELYRQYSDRAETPRPSLKEVFESLQLTVASFSQVYIIVDALDELQQGDQVVQAFLSRLSELKAKKSVKYMLTSRVVPRVMDCIQSGLRLEIRASKEDVMRYIDARMNELPKFVSKKPELQKTIKEVIVAAVDGMYVCSTILPKEDLIFHSRFLLARLHLESLVDKMSPTEVRMALESLPKGNEALSIAYDQAIRRIETQKPGMRLIAQKALGWITYAKRPLSVDELRYAIAVQPGHSHFNEEDLSDIDDIVSACRGLVTVDRGHDTQTARLVHYTTQQFLMRTGETYFPNAREISAVNSLTYLLYNDFERGWLLESKDKIFNQGRFVQERVLQHPFLCYAARYWAAHASECTAQSVVDLSLRFLSDDFRVSSATQILFARIVNKYAADGFLGRGLNSQARNPVSGLHLAVYFGFNDMVLKLLDHGFKADSRDGAQRSPLFWAAQMGHAKIVALLLSFNYGEVVRKGRKEQTGAASKLLPTVNSVDVNCRDIIGNTPLTVSRSYGHVGVVLQLLEQVDISPNLAPENGCTPLTYAARRGDAAILRLLVAHADIDINDFPPGGRTALTWAIRGSSKDLVSILLSHANIDVNLEDSGGQTPLIAAISQNNEEIVKLLLAHPRMDVSCSSRDGITALTVATICGYKPIEKLLLACTGYNWNSTLGYTSQAGYEWLSERGHLVEAQMSFKLHTETRSRLVRKLGKEPHDEVDFLQHQAIIELLQERTDDDIHFIGEEGNKLLSRVAQYSQEISEPRLERVTALLNTAVEDRSRAIPDWVPNSQNGPSKEQHESQNGHSNNLQTPPNFPSSNLISIRLKRPSVGFEPSESLVQKNKYDQGAVLR